MTVGVHSEVGRPRRVIVHRPGLEHSRLTPSNAEELLFDDVIWVGRAEHDMFVEAMRGRGIEVFHTEQLLAEALIQSGATDWVAGPYRHRARSRHHRGGSEPARGPYRGTELPGRGAPALSLCLPIIPACERQPGRSRP